MNLKKIFIIVYKLKFKNIKFLYNLYLQNHFSYTVFSSSELSSPSLLYINRSSSNVISFFKSFTVLAILIFYTEFNLRFLINSNSKFPRHLTGRDAIYPFGMS